MTTPAYYYLHVYRYRHQHLVRLYNFEGHWITCLKMKKKQTLKDFSSHYTMQTFCKTKDMLFLLYLILIRILSLTLDVPKKGK